MASIKSGMQDVSIDVVFFKEDDWFVAWAPEIDLSSCGKTLDEASKNMADAIDLYLEDPDRCMPRPSAEKVAFKVMISSFSARIDKNKDCDIHA